MTGATPKKSSIQVRLAEGSDSYAASAARRRFDGLVSRLESCRASLQAWNEALPRWRERYHEQLEPLFRQRDDLDCEKLDLLDRAHATYKLGKTDRGFLSELICALAGPLIEQGHVRLKPLYDRHSAVGYDERGEASRQLAKELLGAHLGLAPDELDELASAEGLFEKLRERERAQQAHARERQERARARKARSKGKPDPAEPPNLPPARELYRKLATALHPDREADPSERARKTELMQRLNQAYKAGNLLALIELQLEIGQLLPEQLRRMDDARICDYNRELDRQLKEIESELLQVEEGFRAEYGLTGGRRLDPAKLNALMAGIKRDLGEDILDTEAELRALQTQAEFKRWLKGQRERAEWDAQAFGGLGSPS